MAEKEAQKIDNQSSFLSQDQSCDERQEILLPSQPIECCNDFVAIMQQSHKSPLVIDETFKNEGIVVGVGPGVSDGAGGRLTVCVAVNDYVMFGEKNIVSTLQFGNGQRIVIVSERNIICKLPTTEMVDA